MKGLRRGAQMGMCAHMHVCEAGGGHLGAGPGRVGRVMGDAGG